MRKAKTTTLTLAVLTAVIMTVSGCAPQRPVPWRPAAQPVPEPVQAGPAKAALLLPLSGPSEAVGQDLLNAAQMALFDAGDNQLELLPFDTGSEPAGAVAATQAALASGAKVMIGPLFGPSTVAIAPVAGQAGAQVLSLSNDSSVARPGVWVMGMRPEEQIERVVRFSAQNGVTRMSALAPADAYGNTAIQAFQNAVASTGNAHVVDVATYPPSQSTPAEAVRRVAAGLGIRAPTDPSAAPAPTDAGILIADGGSRLRAVASLLAYQDVDPRAVKQLGTMRFADDPGALVDPQLQGAWLAGPSPDEAAAFTARFNDLFGRVPSRVAILAYDTTAMVAQLSNLGPIDLPRLTDRQGFLGRAGIFRLLPDGKTERGLAVLEVNQGTLRVVDPAPVHFADQLAIR